MNLVDLGEEIADTLIAQSFPPLMPRPPGHPILTVTFVNNQDLDKATDFGRTLQDHVSSRFVQQGFSVKELKLRHNLLVRQDNGEFMLTRNLNDIIGKQKAQAVVVGTYALANRVLYLSVRLVDPHDNVIRSTWDKRICLDENTLKMLGFQYEEMDGFDLPRRSPLDSILY